MISKSVLPWQWSADQMLVKTQKDQSKSCPISPAGWLARWLLATDVQKPLIGHIASITESHANNKNVTRKP